MNYIFILFGIIEGLIIIFCIQNLRVYLYRQKICAFIYHKNVEEINKGKKDFFWRNSAYDRVGYNEMVFKLWKRFDSFYPTKLIKEMKKQPEYCRKPDFYS